jgi:hypothetical protein
LTASWASVKSSSNLLKCQQNILFLTTSFWLRIIFMSCTMIFNVSISSPYVNPASLCSLCWAANFTHLFVQLFLE